MPLSNKAWEDLERRVDDARRRRSAPAAEAIACTDSQIKEHEDTLKHCAAMHNRANTAIQKSTYPVDLETFQADFRATIDDKMASVKAMLYELTKEQLLTYFEPLDRAVESGTYAKTNDPHAYDTRQKEYIDACATYMANYIEARLPPLKNALLKYCEGLSDDKDDHPVRMDGGLWDNAAQGRFIAAIKSQKDAFRSTVFDTRMGLDKDFRFDQEVTIMARCLGKAVSWVGGVYNSYNDTLHLNDQALFDQRRSYLRAKQDLQDNAPNSQASRECRDQIAALIQRRNDIMAGAHMDIEQTMGPLARKAERERDATDPDGKNRAETWGQVHAPGEVVPVPEISEATVVDGRIVPADKLER